MVSPLDAAPQTDLQGVAVGRGWPADLGQGLWGRPWRSARSDERRPSAQKSGHPDDLAQPQAGVGRLDGLDQPTRPAGGDHRPSHRTTVTRLPTGCITTSASRSRTCWPARSRWRPRCSTIRRTPFSVFLDHDLRGRGPRGGLDLARVRAHHRDPTAGLVSHNDHPTPAIPTKNPIQKHKPTQTVQLRSGYAGTGQSRTGSTGALTSSQARTGTSCAPLTARFVSVALRNLATRPHPPLPRLWRLYRLDHQIPVKTLRTSHQPTDPTKLLNRLCRSPDSCGDLLIVSALDSGQ